MNHSELSHIAGAVDDSTINIVKVIIIIIIIMALIAVLFFIVPFLFLYYMSLALGIKLIKLGRLQHQMDRRMQCLNFVIVQA